MGNRRNEGGKMTEFWGMDTAQVLEHVEKHRSAVGSFLGLVKRLDQANSAEDTWFGPDAAAFSTALVPLARCADDLEEFGEALRTQAHEQQRASAAGRDLTVSDSILAVAKLVEDLLPAGLSFGARMPTAPPGPLSLQNTLSEAYTDDGLDVPESSRWDPFDPGEVPEGMTETEARDRIKALRVAEGDYALSQDDADAILKHYQVEEDEMVMWELSGPNRWISDLLGMTPEPVPMTRTEAQMLDALGPLEAKAFHDDKLRAEQEADARYVVDGHNGLHDQEDAFRHAYLNALHAQSLGDEWTTDFWTAHERKPNNLSAEEAMDLHNNEVGRRIAAQNPHASKDELADLVEQAVADGQMVVIDPSGHLVPSNSVGLGETGAPERETLPGHGQEKASN